MNVKITSVVTKEELAKILSKEFHLTVTEDDFLTFLNKEISFECFVNHLIKNGNEETVFTLFDDVVKTKNVIIAIEDQPCVTIRFRKMR